MTTNTPVSFETLKLRLIGQSKASNPHQQLTEEGIQYLLRALIYADASFSTDIESVLVKSGKLAVPALIRSLGHENINVRSVSAMALIRLGHVAKAPLLKAFSKYKTSPNAWVFLFVLQELGMDSILATKAFFQNQTSDKRVSV